MKRYINRETREPVTPMVKITIQGGVVEVNRKDKGIHFIIVDKDGEQVGEGTKTYVYVSGEKVGITPKGKRYIRFHQMTPQV